MKSAPEQKEGWHLNYAEIIFYLFFFKCWVSFFFIMPPMSHGACSNSLSISEYSTVKPQSCAISFYGRVLSWMSSASGVVQAPDSSVENAELSLTPKSF